MRQGDPTSIRVDDNREHSLDRDAVVSPRRPREGVSSLWRRDQPSHPQGVWSSGWRAPPIDHPGTAHLGTRITFEQLPSACPCAVRRDEQHLWHLEDATMPQIDIGTRVRYRATFLRAIGCHTGQMSRAIGTVERLVPLGERWLAQVTWDDPDELPGHVLTSNLWPVGRPEPA